MLGDPLFWILVLPGLLLGIYAQGRIKANVAKYSQVGTRGGITGAQVARELLDSQGLRERGDRVHARDAERPLRSSFQDIAPEPAGVFCPDGRGRRNCGARGGTCGAGCGRLFPSRGAYLHRAARAARFAGCALGVCRWNHAAAIDRGVDRCHSLRGVFASLRCITLPVEFNASARALNLLVSRRIIQGDEQIAGVREVLSAAAWTYVAAAVSALGSWLFYVFVLPSQVRPERAR